MRGGLGAIHGYTLIHGASSLIEKHENLKSRLDEMMVVIREQFGPVMCNVSLLTDSEPPQLFIKIPFAGSASDGLQKIDVIDVLRRTFSRQERRALQIDVEFV